MACPKECFAILLHCISDKEKLLKVHIAIAGRKGYNPKFANAYMYIHNFSGYFTVYVALKEKQLFFSL